MRKLADWELRMAVAAAQEKDDQMREALEKVRMREALENVRSEVQPAERPMTPEEASEPVKPGTNPAAYGPVAIECEHGYDVCPTCDRAMTPEEALVAAFWKSDAIWQFGNPKKADAADRFERMSASLLANLPEGFRLTNEPPADRLRAALVDVRDFLRTHGYSVALVDAALATAEEKP